MGKLEGKVIVITGAARGQGEAEARLFVEEGARVVLGDVLDDLGKEVAESLGDAAIYVHHDVSDRASWDETIARAESAFGRVDALINNAGILRVGMIADMPLEEYQQVIAVNQVGVFLGMQAAFPALKKAGGGAIVNISSVGGLAGMAAMSAYVSSKFAVRGMTKCAAIEFGPHNIRVNSVHPGGVDTPMLDPLYDPADRGGEAGNSIYDSVPIGRISAPVEIAKLVAFLVSDDSSYCTGSEFIADGGMMAKLPSG